MRNGRGELVPDRRFNTSSILATYLGRDAVGPDRITWDIDNPNKLRLELPGRLRLLLLGLQLPHKHRRISVLPSAPPDLPSDLVITWCCLSSPVMV